MVSPIILKTVSMPDNYKYHVRSTALISDNGKFKVTTLSKGERAKTVHSGATTLD